MNVRGYAFLGMIQFLLFWIAVLLIGSIVYLISTKVKIPSSRILLVIVAIAISLAGWLGLKKVRKPYKAQFAMTKEQKSKLMNAAGNAFLNSGSKD